MTERIDKAKVRWRIWQQLPLLVALIALWMLLWGTASWLSFVSGIVVAVAVTRSFYLPPVELSGRFNPFWFLLFFVRFCGQLVVASFQVAFLAIRPKPLNKSSVVAVDLVTRSDFVMTLTALAISLIPGSVVVEVDRGRSILYLHALGVHDQAGVDALRREVLSVERALVRALGSREDMRRTAA